MIMYLIHHTGSNPVLTTDTRDNRRHTRHCLGNGNDHTEYLSLVGKFQVLLTVGKVPLYYNVLFL